MANSPVLSLIHAIDKSSLLTPDTIVFVEEAAPGALPLETEPFQKLRYKNSRKFGASLLHQLISC
jgi:hypothetical protein